MNRGAQGLLGVSTSVAQGNYVAAGISLLKITNTNPNTVEGLSIVATIGVAAASAGSAIGAVTAGASAGVGIVATGIMSGEIAGVIGGVEMLEAYSTATQAVNAAIENLQAQTDVDDAAFQAYIEQAYLNGALIATATTQGAFPSPQALTNSFNLLLVAAGAFATALLLF